MSDYAPNRLTVYLKGLLRKYTNYALLSSSRGDVEILLINGNPAAALKYIFYFFSNKDPFITNIDIRSTAVGFKGRIETQQRVVEVEYTEIDERQSKLHIKERYSRGGLSTRARKRAKARAKKEEASTSAEAEV